MIPRKVSVKATVGDDYLIRTNRELYELFYDMNVAIGSAGSAMSFGWMKMRWSAIIGGSNDNVRVGKTRLRGP